MADPTNTSVSVTWSPPLDANGIISSYEVTLTSVAVNPSPQTVGSSGSLEAIFLGLGAFVNYTASVRPFTGNGAIAGSTAEVDFTTDVGSEWGIAYLYR